MIMNILSDFMEQSQQKFKGFVVIDKKDAEIAELLNLERSSITKWRTQTRFPNFDSVLEYEAKLKLPLECFTDREPNLEAILLKLENQLNALKSIDMAELKDAKIAEILDIQRATVTRWRTQTRFPSFDKVLKYEEQLGLPFECIIDREPDFKEIKEKLNMQIKSVKKVIKDKEQGSLV